jgi:thioredoxin reductase
MKTHDLFDVIIVGGSYAGMSAGLALGRSLRKTLIIDAGLPCNRQTPHSQNFLTQDGSPPAQIAAIAREQLLKYESIEFRSGFVKEAGISGELISVVTDSGERFTGRKLIMASGIRDLLPTIPGLAECWGISVIHCPYCHGYEYRGKKTGILANGDAAIHYAMLVGRLASGLFIYTNGKAEFGEDTRRQLEKNGIPLVETDITAVEHRAGYLTGLRLSSGAFEPLDALYARVPFEQHSGIPAMLGCAFDQQGYIQIDHAQKTSVPNVFACGDNCSPMRSVANAVAGGNLAGAMANMELAKVDFGLG